MARYQAISSGDTGSFIGGKIASALQMARAESDAQERDKQAGLNVANSGNLFIKALGSEFGGDLFSRTIGVLNPNQSHAQTDRASSKASRFAANFPRSDKQDQEVKKSNEDVNRAVDDLLKDDDHTPVKDDTLREYVTRVFGVGIDSKLTQLDQRVSKSLSVVSDIRTSQRGSVDLQIDHNELIAGKLDKILTLYNEQFSYQSILKDRAQIAGKENELELKRDLSSTRRFQGLNYNAGGGAILGGLSDKIIKSLVNVVLEKFGVRKLLGKLGKGGDLTARLFGVAGRRGLLRSRWATVLAEVVGGRNFQRTIQKGGSKSAGIRLGMRYIQKSFEDPKIAGYIKTGIGRGAVRKYQQSTKATIKASRAAAGQDAILDVINSKLDPTEAADKAFRGLSENITKNPEAGAKILKNLKQGKPATTGIRNPIKKTLASTTGKKAAKKIGTKAATKGIAKSSKLIPGWGTIYAIGEAGFRASQGDWTGAGLSLLSAIPILGWGATAVDIARDVGYNPLGLPPPPGEQAFEQGNRFGLTNRGVSMLHGTEHVQSIDPKSGMATSHIQNIGDTLVSTSMKMAKDFGVDRDISSKITSLPFAVKSISYNTGVRTAPVRSFTSDTFIEQNQFGLDMKKSELPAEATDGEGGKFRPLQFFADAGSDLWRWGKHHLVGGKKTIGFHGEQGRDRSGEPGIDFSYDDFKNNYSLFNGVVIETGKKYGDGYGNVVVIRSIDPTNGKEFDALYAHFPDGGIAVRPGQTVRGGDYLGRVGFDHVDTPKVAKMQPNNAGNMSGWHTSVDFFEPDSTTAYSNGGTIVNLILSARGVSPSGNNILNKLKPEDKSEDDYSFEKEYIKEMEGSRNDVYLDSKLKPTVGIGHLIDAGSPTDIRNLQVGDEISDERVQELFEMDWEHHLEAAKRLPGWDSATKRQRAALIDLVYNMGPNFLDNFPSMRRALEQGNFNEAVRQLEFADPDNRPGVKSQWFHDVKERRNQPTLDLLRDIHPNQEHLKHLPKLHSQAPDVAPPIQSPISISLLDDLVNGSKMHDDLDSKSKNLRVVVLNNNVINRTTVKKTSSPTKIMTNNLELYKQATLAG